MSEEKLKEVPEKGPVQAIALESARPRSFSHDSVPPLHGSRVRSASECVSHGSGSPMIHRQRSMGRKVLVAIDGSVHGHEAMIWYIENMWRPTDVCSLIHVYTTPHLPVINFSFTKFKFNIPHELWQKKLQDALDAAQKVIKKYESLCLNKGVHYQTLLVSGSPGECICHAVNEQHIETVVMGTRGLNTVRKTLLGSVSTYTLHHANVPVTVVPSLPHGENLN
eukprot:m.8278 g.8278  ORF g.8278 m.8278 type:complete len:223 (+) comp20465_c0_seq2:60-728(+)